MDNNHKAIEIKCPCGAHYNVVYVNKNSLQGARNVHWTTCHSCRRDFQYQIINGRCKSWYK